MQLEKHKAGVGLFILATLALLICGIIALGGGRYFSRDTEYVLYFDSSVNGLTIGSPVMLRGVPLGAVTRITLMTGASDTGVTTPVNIRINADNLVQASGERVHDEVAEQEIIRTMISKGMRAQLQTASLLTGQARIQLDFYPDVPARFRSPTPLLEIPTVASPIESLQKSLSKVPVEEMAARLQNSLVLINEFLASGSLQRTVDAMEATLTTTNSLLQDLGDAPELVEKILANLAVSTDAVKKETPATLAEFRKALQDFGAASAQLKVFASAATELVSPDAVLSNNLERLLRDGAAAARSLRNFADTLERNPESILRGRQGAY